MLYEVVLREVRIVRRIVRVEAAERAEARTAALDPDKWLTESDLHDDVANSELDSMAVAAVVALRGRV